MGAVARGEVPIPDVGSPPSPAQVDEDEDRGNITDDDHEEDDLDEVPALFVKGAAYSPLEDPWPEFNYVSPLLIPHTSNDSYDTDDHDDGDETESPSAYGSPTLCGSPPDSRSSSGTFEDVPLDDGDSLPCTPVAASPNVIPLAPLSDMFQTIAGMQSTVTVVVTTSDTSSDFKGSQEDEYPHRTPELAVALLTEVRTLSICVGLHITFFTITRSHHLEC